jgi:hypothetical protein
MSQYAANTRNTGAVRSGRPSFCARLWAVCLLFLLRTASAQAPRVLDSVDFSAEASRTAHGVILTQATIRSESAKVGTLQLPVAGAQLAPGGKVSARLKTAALEGGPVSVLITLATLPKDHGKLQSYAVSLDGKQVYTATESDPGAGITRSFFIDIPKPAATSLVEVTADPASQVPITVSSMRSYASLMPPLSSLPKLGLALLSNKGSGYTIDAETIREIYRTIPASPFLDRQAAVLYNFCVRTAPENAAEIDRLAAMAENLNVPLRIAFQVHWGGSPTGVSDGAAGTFTDLPYQQVTFDPDDKVDDPGLASILGDRNDVRYGLSVPNVWGDRPWLTFNHPRLNQLRRIRLMQALLAWNAARQQLAAKGKGRLLPPELSTGEETVYWAKGVEDKKYTDLNGGKARSRLMADFNPFVVNDAIQDRINLDPRDGLDNNERWWLHQNLARQQQRVIDWMLEALPAEPVRLLVNGPVFAQDMVRRNLYTEPYAMPLFPLKDVNARRPGLEVGYVKNGRSGGEYWSGATMLPWLLKERERGRIALPNLECTGADDGQLVACLRAAYACGARFATLYNWHKRETTPQILRDLTDSIEKPAGVEFPSAAVGYGKRWERTYTAPADAFGVNRIEFFGIEARQGDVPVRVTLREAEGKTPAAVSLITEIAAPTGKATTTAVLLPTLFPQEPGRRYTFVIESLSGEAIGLGLASDANVAVRLVADIATERARSVAIQDWQDAADLLASLKETHGRSEQSLFAREALEQAQTLFATNQPRAAYTAGIRAEQLSLPAAFDVPSPGTRLAPYWITILCPGGPVRATITAYSARAATVSIKSAVAQEITLRWGMIDTKATLAPNVPAEISLEQPAPVRAE